MSAHLNINDRNGGLGLVKVASHPVHCLWDEVQHQVQIHFIFLKKEGSRKKKKKTDLQVEMTCYVIKHSTEKCYFYSDLKVY